MIKNRNIALAIEFTILTCGIYGIYWFITLTNNLNQLTPEDAYQTSGGMAFLFTLITCGIYGIYWNYKMGAKVDVVKGVEGGNSAILFLVLSLFGLGIVNYCIMQSTLNEHATE